MRLAPLLIASLMASAPSYADPAAAPPAAPPAAPAAAPSADEPGLAKPIAAGAVATLYLGYAVWSYFAWYRGADSSAFHREESTGFEFNSYAGGADKLGHAWASYALARGTTGLLAEAGWDKRRSSFLGAGLSEMTFLLTELQDGFTVGFDYEDEIANTTGVGLSLLLDNVPAIDRWIDFRVAYFPSAQYRRNFRDHHSLDVAQDYTGQTYLLAVHLAPIPERPRWLEWSRYVDVVVGFDTRHYSPPEPMGLGRKQSLYVGVAVDMQEVLSSLFCDCLGRRIGRGVFEVVSLPYTTLPVATSSRTAP